MKKTVMLLIGMMILSGCQIKQDYSVSSVKNTKTVNKTSKEKTTSKKKAIRSVKIAFDYTRMSTQASNQIAIWVTDQKGKLVKTIYVSDFTGVGRGYRFRKEALSHWVKAAQPSKMSDPQIDAVSGATPESGRQSYVWNLTNQKGKKVTPGKYIIKLEGTLYWKSNVVYSATVDTRSSKAGKLKVTSKRSKPHDTDNENMIRHVRMQKIS